MTIPDFQTLMLPLLKIAADQKEHSQREVRDLLAENFRLTETDKKEMLPSGKQARFDNRVAWARAYLKRADLIENTGRGIFRITPQGLDLLRSSLATKDSITRYRDDAVLAITKGI
jgi:restriction system protein